MRLLDSHTYISDIKKAIENADLSGIEGKSIFITGGLGLICSTIIDVLLVYEKTARIYVGARNEQAFKKRYGDIKNLYFVRYDALNNLNIDCEPDYIICGAGLASPELYSSKPVETILSNFEGVHALLDFLIDKPEKRLLYISSSEVYGKKESAEPFVEGNYGTIDIDSIRSSYAIGKIASEMMCKAYHSEYGVDTVIVRPGHIFGPSAKRTDKRISSEFAFKAAEGSKLEMKSSGIQKRSYCYSIDCALQILYVLVKGNSGQAYNVGHDEVITIRHMAETYAKAGNVEISLVTPTKEECRNFNPMNNSSLNNSKIKSLGYKDTFSTEEGLCHTVKILKEILH